MFSYETYLQETVDELPKALIGCETFLREFFLLKDTQKIICFLYPILFTLEGFLRVLIFNLV